MECPQCGARTEVSEKRGPFRERRCTNAACLYDFTTREQIMRSGQQALKPFRRGRLCARTRATQIEAPAAAFAGQGNSRSAAAAGGGAAAEEPAPREQVVSPTRQAEVSA